MPEHERPGPSGSPRSINSVESAQSGAPDAAVRERLFAELFDISPFPAVVSRVTDHTVIAINSRTSEIFGVAKDEAPGLRVTDYYVDPRERSELAERLARQGRVDNMRIQIRRPGGAPFWALFSARLVMFSGEPAILTVFTDISEQVSAEGALRANEQRLAAQSNALTALTARYADPAEPFDERLRGILRVCAETLDVARLSMWRTGGGGLTIRCIGLHNRAADRYESGALLFRPEAPAYFSALDRERVIAADDALTDPRTAEFGAGYLRPHGIGAMLDVPLRRDNRTLGVLCAEHIGGARAWTVDEQNFAVSAANLVVAAVADEERRTALLRLAESDARANLIVDTAHDAFIGIDSTGRVVTWNAQAERTFGWTRDEVIGRRLADTVIPPRFREAHNRGFERFHRTGEAPVVNHRLELAGLHRSGREFPIEITITAPTRRAEGFFFGAFLRDISDRLERDAQLRRAKESAEAATRAKSEFLANMSHELRTPLNGVLGYTQLLQRDRTLTAAQREALDAITKCGSHLLDLINDVLDLSKIEAGRVDIEPVSTDLVQLTIDLKYVLADAARHKGLQLATIIAPDVPRRVVLDGRHLRQVLLNLLGNAVKFTERGQVRLAIARTDDGRLGFEVSDTGIGIEPQALTMIFESFTQTEAGAAAGGTGLGLAISSRLVERMGDRLQVESRLGEGSRFYFALPLVEGAPGAEPADAELAEPALEAHLAPGQQVHALVVDDSTVSRRILASLLESGGVNVITAAGGLEALRLAHDHRPDVIFMDLRMSDLDGFEATKRLRQDPLTAAIPVVAVTASAFGDTRQAAREAGCAEYLPKPVRAPALFGVRQTLLGARFVTAPQAAAEPVSPGTPARATRADVAVRLGDAVAIGSITDLERLAEELGAPGSPDAALGQRISRLAGDFDFDALRDLASVLARQDAR
jgi:PAS domain S-box-containing protein